MNTPTTTWQPNTCGSWPGLFVGIASLLLLSACGDSIVDFKPKDVDSGVEDLAKLEAIPADRLGSGRFAFKRVEEGQENIGRGMHIVDLDSNENWTITGKYDWPRISPEGNLIAYAVWAGIESVYDIYTMNARGTGVRKISNNWHQDWGPAWSSDGSMLYYYHGASPLELYARSATDPTALQRRLNNQNGHLNYKMIGIVDNLDVSDGLIVYSGFRCEPVGFPCLKGIGLFDVASGAVEIIIADPGNSGSLYIQYRAPSWSPDGQRIAFLEVQRNISSTSDQTSGDGGFTEMIGSRLMIMDTNSGVVEAMVSLSSSGPGYSGNYDYYSTAWSPDGTWIAFNHWENKDESHIYAFNVSSNELLPVTTRPNVMDTNVSWSRE